LLASAWRPLQKAGAGFHAETTGSDEIGQHGTRTAISAEQRIYGLMICRVGSELLSLRRGQQPPGRPRGPLLGSQRRGERRFADALQRYPGRRGQRGFLLSAGE
jgi:hypothetical protein